MRLYNKYYVSKNPHSSNISKSKRELSDSIFRILNSGASRNPSIKEEYAIASDKLKSRSRGSSIEAYNLLGRLNKLISDGYDQYIPLRDTISAEIEGYLDGESLKLSIDEAVRNLHHAEVKFIKEEVRKAQALEPAIGFSRARLESIKKKAEQDPHIKSLRTRVSRLKSIKAKDDTEGIARRRRMAAFLSSEEFIRGEKRLEQIRKSDKQARKEIGDRYVPDNKALWDKAKSRVLSRYPDGYVKPSSAYIEKLDRKAMEAISDSSISDSDRKSIENNFKKSLKRRFIDAVIEDYESIGGRRRISRKLSEESGYKKFGLPFQLKSGIFGAISRDNGSYKWMVMDSSINPLMSGSADSVNSAGKNIKISERVLINLLNLDRITGPDGESLVGWDNLDERDRRWLSSNKPKINKSIARMLIANIGDKVKVNESIIKWIASAAKISKEFEIEGKEMAKKLKVTTVRDMSLGEDRVFKGRNNKYRIHVNKVAGGWKFIVESKDARSDEYMERDSSKVLPRAHAIGGMMAGISDVEKSIDNPEKINKLINSASRYNRKSNPSKKDRDPASVGDIRSLSKIYTIPGDSDEAFAAGYVFGIERGIDTCGVQNFFKRRKMKQALKDQLYGGAKTLAKSVIEKKEKKKEGRSKRTIFDYDLD